MKNLDITKLTAVAGFLLVLLAIILKIWGAPPVNIGTVNIRLVSVLVMANTCFLVAILFKK